MSNFILIIFCLLLGIVLKQIPQIPENMHKGLNAFVIYVSLPAISLLYIPELDLNWQVLYPFLSGWLILFFAWGFFLLLQPFIRWERQTLGCLILVCGLGNISFVGFPIVEAFYGQEGLEIALFVDQGTFLALSIVGVSLAMIYSSGKVESQVIVQKIITFPPFIAFSLAILITLLNIHFSEDIKAVLKTLGSTLTPLSLTSIGLQLRLKGKGISIANLSWGLLYKLILAPALIAALYIGLLEGKNLLTQVSVMEAAMPPMVTASIIATEYNLNPNLANLLVGLGLIVSLPLLYAWFLVLG